MNDEPIPEIYFSRDFPVLKAIARWEAADRRGDHIRPESIAQELKLPVETVVQSLGRLYHGGLVDAVDASSQDAEFYFVRRLTAAGLRESGLWHKEPDLAEGLRVVLEREIKVSRSDPKRRQRLQEILDAATELGVKFPREARGRTHEGRTPLVPNGLATSASSSGPHPMPARPARPLREPSCPRTAIQLRRCDAAPGYEQPELGSQHRRQHGLAVHERQRPVSAAARALLSANGSSHRGWGACRA